MRQGIAHEVNAAPLPGGGEHLGNGGLDPLMGIGDDQLDAAEAPPRQLAQELRSDRFGF